jgi:formaldehyde-activating enzyme
LADPIHVRADEQSIVCGVFIHWEADDDKRIYQYNYDATKIAIAKTNFSNNPVQ